MYANTSQNFRIPYWDKGETSSSLSNKRAAQIVDSQLFGHARVLGEWAIIAEGTYSSVFTTGASTVTLTGTPTNYSLEALINGVYVANGPSLVWLAIPDSTTVYLYVLSVEQNLYGLNQISTLATGQVITTFNLTGLTPANAMFVGTATTTGSTITTNTIPSAHDNGQFIAGKAYSTLAMLGTHRSATPLDHPDGSVTSAKLASSLATTALSSSGLTAWATLAVGSSARFIPTLSGLDLQVNINGTGWVSGLSLMPASTLPSTDPHVAGVEWNNGGFRCISQG